MQNFSKKSRNRCDLVNNLLRARCDDSYIVRPKTEIVYDKVSRYMHTLRTYARDGSLMVEFVGKENKLAKWLFALSKTIVVIIHQFRLIVSAIGTCGLGWPEKAFHWDLFAHPVFRRGCQSETWNVKISRSVLIRFKWNWKIESWPSIRLVLGSCCLQVWFVPHFRYRYMSVFKLGWEKGSGTI